MGITSKDLSTALDELTYTNRDAVSSTSKQRGSSELGKDQFLKLLVTQLQNQDPLNPQDDTTFISQLAQFSSLEQMTNMNTTMNNTSAYSLVGKNVIVSSTDSTGRVSEVTGVVDYVEIKNGDAYLSIDGKSYSIDDLVKVMDTTYAVKDNLPSVDEQTYTFDKSQPLSTDVKINLGKNGYEASSVAVVVNGEAIDSKYITFDTDTNTLTILPGAFEKLEAGSYYLGFYFNDPYSTTITDKVTIHVVDKKDSSDTDKTDGSDAADSSTDAGNAEGTGDSTEESTAADA